MNTTPHSQPLHQPQSAPLDGKTALVTGGSSGIGLATAQRLTAQGARVLITGRNERTLQQAQQQLGPLASYLVADMTKTSDLCTLSQRVATGFGQLDMLIANAGTIALNPVHAVSSAEYDELFATNVKGVFLLLQQCLPLLADGAGVVLISSIAHFKVLPGHTVYAATKAALRSLARGFAAELAPRQIRVNCLSPGPVRPPILHKLGVDASALDQLEQQIAGQIPLRRLGEPAEIARAAVFLAGPDASFINGVDLCVDGGMSQL